jgi:hypothetical protein
MSEKPDVMSWLAAGVPVSLLMDLAVPLNSREILSVEGGDAGWLRATG